MATDVFSQLLQPVLEQQALHPLPDLSACPRLSAIVSWLGPVAESYPDSTDKMPLLFWQQWLQSPELPTQWQSLLQPLTHNLQYPLDTLCKLACELLEQLRALLNTVAQQLLQQLGSQPDWSHDALMERWLSIYQAEYIKTSQHSRFIQLWADITAEYQRLLNALQP